MKRLSVGILAHVDSGKTTLSEGMLYSSGDIRKLGRVDHKTSFLDTNFLERERGITIFSKQALLHYGDTIIPCLIRSGRVVLLTSNLATGTGMPNNSTTLMSLSPILTSLPVCFSFNLFILFFFIPLYSDVIPSF